MPWAHAVADTKALIDLSRTVIKYVCRHIAGWGGVDLYLRDSTVPAKMSVLLRAGPGLRSVLSSKRFMDSRINKKACSGLFSL